MGKPGRCPRQKQSCFTNRLLGILSLNVLVLQLSGKEATQFVCLLLFFVVVVVVVVVVF